MPAYGWRAPGLKTINSDPKQANKQDIRYYSIDNNRQANIQLLL